MTPEENIKLLDDMNAKLAEHFEATQILVTWRDGEYTKSLCRGAGNFYARKALAEEFIADDIARGQAREIAQELNTTEGGDDWKHDGSNDV